MLDKISAIKFNSTIYIQCPTIIRLLYANEKELPETTKKTIKHYELKNVLLFIKILIDIEEELSRYSKLESDYPNPKLIQLKEHIINHSNSCDQKNEEMRGKITIT